MDILQSTEVLVPVRLLNATTGVGITGKTYADVTIYLEKYGGASTVKALAGASEFVEVDATNMPGKYNLKLTAANTDTLRFLTYSVACALADTYIGILWVRAVDESSIYTRLGAPAGASLAADVAAVNTTVSGQTTTTRWP